MNYVRTLGVIDLLIAVLLLLFLIHGLRRGFLRSLFGLLAFGAGWIVASRFHLDVAARWGTSRPEADIALRLGVFLLLFIITALLVRLIGLAAGGVISGTSLSLIDRLLGGICGVGIGAVFFGILFLIATTYFPGGARVLADSKFHRPLTGVVRVLSNAMSEEMKERLKGFEGRAPREAAKEIEEGV
ncbi:MAG: CvpA family protein [Candidatus Eisenbacteria bacterium]